MQNELGGDTLHLLGTLQPGSAGVFAVQNVQPLQQMRLLHVSDKLFEHLVPPGFLGDAGADGPAGQSQTGHFDRRVHLPHQLNQLNNERDHAGGRQIQNDICMNLNARSAVLRFLARRPKATNQRA